MRIARRSFLAAAVSAPVVWSGSVRGSGTLERPLRVALVGCGMQGQKRLETLLLLPQTQVVVACDCDQRKWEFPKRQGIPCVMRYEEILADRSIDVVFNATPDHWHGKITVDACRAGKDVFCESPLGITPAECEAMKRAAAENHRIVACGELLSTTLSGNVAFVETGSLPVAFRTPAMPVPVGLDWERWQGPAKHVPFNAWRLENWRMFSDYGHGSLGQGGADRFAAVLRQAGLEDKRVVRLLPPHSDGNPYGGVCVLFENGFRLYHNAGQTVSFPSASPAVEAFFHAVRTRQEPAHSLAVAARAAMLCRQIVHCYQQNRPLV